MRVALFSRNARSSDAIGQQVAAKLAYFQQRGAEVRLYLSEVSALRPEAAAIKPVMGSTKSIWSDPLEREYLLTSDLVVAEFGAAYDLMNLLPVLTGQGPRIIVDYRGVTPVELGDTGLQTELEAAARQRGLLWCADAVLVQSRFAADELHDSIGLHRERIHQIACWMESPRKTDADSVRRLRDKHRLSGAQVLLFVGRLARNKQPERLIEALARLDASAQAVFVGCQSDAYRERLEQCRRVANQLNVSHRVHFLGSVTEVELAAWYQAADVLVLPSRHECFGMPVVEAMLRGVPVVASDAGSLPEVMGHAGLTAGAENVDELAQQIARYCVTPASCSHRRVALVTHRFGTQFAGGAEKSLRLMAQALQSKSYEVEVYTTCNTHESRWANTLPAGTKAEEGFVTHRFLIDPYDSERLGKSYEAIRRSDGKVSTEVEEQYLQHSLGSEKLIEALVARRSEFAVIFTGPYLFKLTYEVASRFSDQVLLAPCFHDEPLARLAVFQKVYRQVGGLLFHTEAEARFTASQLAINHPRHTVIGTMLDECAFTGSAQRGQARMGGPYLVYCGRYCPEKGLDRLLNYMEHLHRTTGTMLKLVCLGQGPMKLPSRPWLIDLGFVTEEVKRDVIAGAMALVNLSRNESLSIVALEAWALGVPVIADAGCAVLKDQVARANGGICIADRQGFADAVVSLCNHTAKVQSLGRSGKEFVQREYASSGQFADRLENIVQSLQLPLREAAIQAGLLRGADYSQSAWDERYSAILEQAQLVPARSLVAQAAIKPVQNTLEFPTGSESGTVTIRLINQSQALLATQGPARARLFVQVHSTKGQRLTPVHRIALTSALLPEQEQLVVAAFELPHEAGRYRLKLRLVQRKQVIADCSMPLKIIRSYQPAVGGGQEPQALGPLLQAARTALSQAKRLEQLPEEYQDVTEGSLASVKLMLKRKLLNNFRKAYVDVAFRQQSALNEKLIAVMSLLLETQTSQDTGVALAQMQRRLERLELAFKKERQQRRKLENALRKSRSPDVSLMEGN